jgi:hypothetical protein
MILLLVVFLSGSIMGIGIGYKCNTYPMIFSIDESGLTSIEVKKIRNDTDNQIIKFLDGDRGYLVLNHRVRFLGNRKHIPKGSDEDVY